MNYRTSGPSNKTRGKTRKDRERALKVVDGRQVGSSPQNNLKERKRAIKQEGKQEGLAVPSESAINPEGN
ncbi:hypothetical protein Dda_4830 [Drechslerella dactyloides]|uniref:Uncharacterized protein n=1 Tax=Drechslerella dactyloides TaxID=74499 RepID=A0AAD6NJF9_DREDA|nr:hypothetical protein Dda_4830 [Drechslerella dactyloides]